MKKQNAVKNWWQNKQLKKEEKKRQEELQIVKAYVDEKEQERKDYQLKEKNKQLTENDDVPTFDVYYGKWVDGVFIDRDQYGEPNKKVIRPDNAYVGIHSDIWFSKYINLGKRVLILLWTLQDNLRQKGIEPIDFKLVNDDGELIQKDEEGQFLLNIAHIRQFTMPAYEGLQLSMLEAEYANQVELVENYYKNGYKEEFKKDIDFLFLKSVEMPLEVEDSVLDNVLSGKANEREELAFALFTNQKLNKKTQKFYQEVADYAEAAVNMIGPDEFFKEFKKSSDKYYELSDKLFKKYLPNETP